MQPLLDLRSHGTTRSRVQWTPRQLVDVVCGELPTQAARAEPTPVEDLRVELSRACSAPTVLVGFAASTAALAGESRSCRALYRPASADGVTSAGTSGARLPAAQNIDLVLYHDAQQASDTLRGCTRTVANPRFADSGRVPESTHSGQLELDGDWERGKFSARAGAQLARGFRSTLLINLADGLQPPLRAVCDRALQRLLPLYEEMQQIIAGANSRQAMVRRCLAESFDHRLLQFRGCERDLLDDLPLDGAYFGNARTRSAPPPGTSDRALGAQQEDVNMPGALATLLAQCNQTLAWAEALPAAVLRDLRAWRKAAREAVSAARRLGVRLKVRRLPPKALRTLECHQLQFLIANVEALSDPEAVQDQLNTLLDARLNSAPLLRPWLFDVWLQDHDRCDYVDIDEMFCLQCVRAEADTTGPLH